MIKNIFTLEHRKTLALQALANMLNEYDPKQAASVVFAFISEHELEKMTVEVEELYRIFEEVR